MEVCNLHGIMMTTVDRIEAKLDDVIMGRETIAASVAAVQKTIDNGLRGDIKSALEAIHATQEVLERFDKRVVLLENFGWFRDWVTEMRTNVFKNTFKLIAICILGLTLFHASDTVVKTLLQGIIK